MRITPCKTKVHAVDHGHEPSMTMIVWLSPSMTGPIYRGQTTIYNGHAHHIHGRVSGKIGPDASHVHYFEGVASMYGGHNHNIRGYTSPPIPLPGGLHYHRISGQCTLQDGHTHYFYGRTAAST